LAAALVDGQRVKRGDRRFPFAIESISKVATLALALEQFAPDVVQRKLGADPTGLPFDSVAALELHGDRPHGPLVTAGAIVTVSLLKAQGPQDRCSQILALQGRLAGRSVGLSDTVNQSEQTTNADNRAIAWLLCSAGTLYCDPMETCDVYTRQCSTWITCLDLAVMGATWANARTNPLTHEQVLTLANEPPLWAEMTTEGLDETSGDWDFRVG
jgi:glutaminase